MQALFQRLKELDPVTFEELCFQIWSERLPGAGLHHVEGKAGDKGTDLFAGVLAGKPAIWQCKFFKDGVKDSQKRQIKKSLKSALKHFSPSLWTLCVPINLDINAHAWFQELAQSHSLELKIELFDASMIVKELIFRRSIRTVFFPGAVMEVGWIKAMLLGTGNYTDEQLSKVADETIEQYIDRLREKEPRYDYQVSYHSGSSGLANLGIPTLPRNTIMSMVQGNRRLDLVARDVEALRKDPPHVTLELSAEGLEKIQHALRSGSPTQLARGELVGFHSSFDFLRTPEQLEQPHELLLVPQFRTIRESFRVSFISGAQRVTYDLIEFDITARQREVEFSSASKHVPFHMQLNFGLDSPTWNFKLVNKFPGHDVRDVQKLFKALRTLRAAGELDLFDLKKQKSFAPIQIELPPASEELRKLEELTDQLAEVAMAFGQRLIVPEVINGKDLETLALLLEVARRGETEGGTVENVTASIVRDQEPADVVLNRLAGEFMIGLENGGYPVQHLLGAPISAGPYRMIIEKASLVDFEEVKRKYQALAPGESMPIRFNSEGRVRLVFHRFHKGEPVVPLVTP